MQSYLWIANCYQRICIREIYQRICDCAIQEWNTQKSQYSKLALYNEVKTELGYESYLSNINVKKFRAALCRLRCSCHGLMIEIGRYELKNIAKENRICQLCNKKGRQVIEDEYHFIVECETFTNLRNMYLKPECLNRNGFVQMLKCNDAEIVWNLAVYVFKAVALRKSLL